MTIEAELKKNLELKSKEHTYLKPKWDKTRIIFKGEDSVHESGELLLSKLGSQDADQYNSYKGRTRFLNAFKRTILGLDGTVKRKPYDVNIESIEEYENDIDLAGTTLKEYSDKVLHEGLKIGVSGTLVDHNDTTDNDLTVAEAEKLNLRPKLSFYVSDSIYKAEKKVINGVKQLYFVVLKETYEDKVDEFVSETLDQYRVLRINDGKYEQQVYKITKDGNVDIMEAIIPEINKKAFDYIPFFLHGDFVEPPLYDLVTTNIKHYQLKADHNHVLHFAGCPTPVRTGVDPKDDTLPTTIGSETIWDLENDKAKAFYMELKGESVPFIVTELETIKEDMAFLGAAILASDNSVEETATKANYRNASETSSLVDIVIDLSNSLTKALKVFAEWADKDSESIYFKYNTDFDISKLTAQEILARVQSWQSGAFSKRSLFKQLKSGEVELESDNFEDEEELIGKGE